MKMQIKNRSNNSVIFECELEKDEECLSFGLRLGISIKKALKAEANLRGADLHGANLRGADLIGADLRDADLHGAYLCGANLREANLRGAYLRDADLRGAYLRDADLSDAYLSGADLRDADLHGAVIDKEIFRDDLWSILSGAPSEAEAVLTALKGGKIDGSAYEGECACLVGTIANSVHAHYKDLPFIKPNSRRPAEQWFYQIKKGDTPENSEACKLATEWVEQWINNMKTAFS